MLCGKAVFSWGCGQRKDQRYRPSSVGPYISKLSLLNTSLPFCKCRHLAISSHLGKTSSPLPHLHPEQSLGQYSDLAKHTQSLLGFPSTFTQHIEDPESIQILIKYLLFVIHLNKYTNRMHTLKSPECN